jgi:uncharacterized protein (DUF169 family)
MTVTKNELAILEKLELEIQPVGVKYLTKVPQNLSKLEQKMTLCEMLKKAQGGNAFYAGVEEHSCDGGTYVLGQTGLPHQFINGEYGAGLGVFQDPRAASRLYHYVPKVNQGVVKFVAFAPISKLGFDPDILIIFGKTSQAEILLRASSYKTGQMWSSRYSSAIGCGWIFIYPYLSGEINYGTTGLGFGMKRRKLFPEGLQWISIPFTALPSFLQTLRDMPWVPPPYKPDGVEFVKKLRIDLGLE